MCKKKEDPDPKTPLLWWSLCLKQCGIGIQCIPDLTFRFQPSVKRSTFFSGRAEIDSVLGLLQIDLSASIPSCNDSFFWNQAFILQILNKLTNISTMSRLWGLACCNVLKVVIWCQLNVWHVAFLNRTWNELSMCLEFRLKPTWKFWGPLAFIQSKSNLRLVFSPYVRQEDHSSHAIPNCHHGFLKDHTPHSYSPSRTKKKTPNNPAQHNSVIIFSNIALTALTWSWRSSEISNWPMIILGEGEQDYMS